MDSCAGDPRVRLRRTRGTPLKWAGPLARSGQSTRSRRSNVSNGTGRTGHLRERSHEGGDSRPSANHLISRPTSLQGSALTPRAARHEGSPRRNPLGGFLPAGNKPERGAAARAPTSAPPPLEASGICPASGAAGPGDQAQESPPGDSCLRATSPSAAQPRQHQPAHRRPSKLQGSAPRPAQPDPGINAAGIPSRGFLPAGNKPERGAAAPAPTSAPPPLELQGSAPRPAQPDPGIKRVGIRSCGSRPSRS